MKLLYFKKYKTFNDIHNFIIFSGLQLALLNVLIDILLKIVEDSADLGINRVIYKNGDETVVCV